MIKSHLHDSKSPVSKLVAREAAPHFSLLTASALPLLAKGSLSLEMALRLVACREPTSVWRVRLSRARLSRWRWHTVRSSRSCAFTCPISPFLPRMKLTSALVSASWLSSLAASALPCSTWAARARAFSRSRESCLAFSRVSWSILRRSSSLEAMWNCSSWQSFCLLEMAPSLMETAVSSSAILACSCPFSSSSCDSDSLRLPSQRSRLRMQLCVLWVRSSRVSPCSRRRPFSRRPFSTSSLSWPICSLDRSCSIPRTSLSACCSSSRSLASAVSSSRRCARSAACCPANRASLSAAPLARSSSASWSACPRSSATALTVSSSRSWLLLSCPSCSLAAASSRPFALCSSSLALSQRS